jgi:ElaB/YqjD/DUF883 family membrane-anchored ribosome-binding protein
MMNSKSVGEELESLQREAAELRALRTKHDSLTESAAGQESTPPQYRNATTKSSVQDSAGVQALLSAETTLKDFAENLERTVKQIDDVVRERPVLAMLVALTAGYVIGNFVSRK